jgi:hypothetical protein
MEQSQWKSFIISMVCHLCLLGGGFIVSYFQKDTLSFNSVFHDIPMDVTVVGETTSTTTLPDLPKEEKPVLNKFSTPQSQKADPDPVEQDQPTPETPEKSVEKNIDSEPLKESAATQVEPQEGGESVVQESPSAFQDILFPLMKKEEKKLQKAESKKKDLKKSVEKKSSKNNKKKDKKKTKYNSMESLLKDLEEKEQSSPTGAQDGPTSPDGKNLPLGASLSISEIDLVRRTIYKHWHLPPGAYSDDRLSIVIQLELNQDGSVAQARIMYNKSTTGHPFFQVAAESALRAIYHPECQPLPLPRDRYHIWKTLELRFSPQS